VIAAGLLHERIGPGGSPWFDFALSGSAAAPGQRARLNFLRPRDTHTCLVTKEAQMLPKSSKRSLVGLLSIAIAGGIVGNILHLTHGFGVEDWVRSKYLELQRWSR
jgi:hypothetical protein